MQTEHALVEHWNQEYDERALEGWVRQLRERFEHPVSLGLVFIAPRYFDVAAEILETIRVHAAVPVLAGCSSQSLIAGPHEIDRDAGIVLALHSFPDTEVVTRHFNRNESLVGDDGVSVSPARLAPFSECNGCLIFANPLAFDGEGWLSRWNRECTGVPLAGGLASAGFPPRRTQVYLNDGVHEDGAVLIGLRGKVRVECVVSQGCTPIGDPWPITRVEQNVLHEIGNRPAFQMLADTFEQLGDAEKQKTSSNLFVGIVLDEYQEEFHRGDFLVRNLISVDPGNGTLSIGAFPRVGQTVQFQRRDGDAAREDLEALLTSAAGRLRADRTRVYGGLLCSCNGRGSGLFKEADVDSAAVQRHFGDLGVSGFFCNGEFGPVGERAFLHGYTASVGLFVGND